METIGFDIIDVLQFAIRMETDGAEYYELASKNASGPTSRLMLTSLAAIERGHKALFEKLLKERQAVDGGHVDPEVDAIVTSFLASWMEGAVFDKDEGAALEVAKSGAIADILRMAVRMEKDSIVFYIGLKDYVADRDAKRILDRIIKEELRHVADLSGAIRGLDKPS
jgi:rubrerythrin